MKACVEKSQIQKKNSPFKRFTFLTVVRVIALLLTKKTQLLVRHSEIVNSNAHLKAEINHLRKERRTTNEVHAQLEASIHQIRADITGLMMQASAINDHREEVLKNKEVGEKRLAPYV